MCQKEPVDFVDPELPVLDASFDRTRKSGEIEQVKWSRERASRSAGNKMEQDRAAIDTLVARFFAVFDNRQGRAPTAREFEALFVPTAVIATHPGGAPQLSTPAAFVEPRINLLTSGALVDFHEWETESQTEVLGSLGIRRSRYSKQGLLNGRPYQGAGTKYFHFARLDHEWRIVSLSWIDDPLPVTGDAA